MEPPAKVATTSSVLAGCSVESPTDAAEQNNQMTTTTHEKANNDEDEDDDEDEDEDDDDAKDAYYEARDELETAFQSALTLASDVRVNICDADVEQRGTQTSTEDARAEESPEQETHNECIQGKCNDAM